MIIEAIEKLCEKATPGPWKYRHGDNFDHWELWNPTDSVWVVQDDSGVEPSTEDLEFIAASRTLVPKLLAVAKVASKASKIPCWMLLRDLDLALEDLENDD